MFGGMSPHFCYPSCSLPVGTGHFGRTYTKPGHSTDLISAAGVDFLRARSGSDERPFFLYVAFTAPHDPRETHWRFHRLYSPNDVPLPASFMPRHPFNLDSEGERDEALAEYPRQPDESRMHEANYYAMITHLDEGIGRLHAAVMEAGFADNTIMVHTSDHGIGLGRHGLMGKQSLYDHSVRVPLIVAGNGFARGSTDDRLCYQHDLFPTLLECAGVPDVLTDYAHLQSASSRDSITCAYSTTMRSIRDEKMKLIEFQLRAGNVTQLFDTRSDPEELRNLAADVSQATTLHHLRSALGSHLQQSGDPFVLV
jgi:arylsulfatase A-like enzyme